MKRSGIRDLFDTNSPDYVALHPGYNYLLDVNKITSILAAVTFALLLPSAVLSDDNSLTKLLDSISVSLESAEPTYRFSYDPDFPCSITISQNSMQDTTRWLRRYRFELSDMTPGQLLMARDSRRAISYYGDKTTADGEVTNYAPKKISAIQIHTASNHDSGANLQQRFDEAIRICEEKNRF